MTSLALACGRSRCGAAALRCTAGVSMDSGSWYAWRCRGDRVIVITEILGGGTIRVNFIAKDLFSFMAIHQIGTVERIGKGPGFGDVIIINIHHLIRIWVYGNWSTLGIAMDVIVAFPKVIRGSRCIRVLGDGSLVVKNRWIPITISGEVNMWESAPLVVSEGADIHVW